MAAAASADVTSHAAVCQRFDSGSSRPRRVASSQAAFFHALMSLV
jgi:hypothetical protein